MKKVWEFLGSIRLAIVVLIVLAVVSVVGIVIPQGLPEQQYLAKWGAGIGGFIMLAGIDRMFSAGWFYALLVVLSVNVAVCSITRMVKNFRRATTPHYLRSPDVLSRYKHGVAVERSGTVDEAATALVSSLKRRFYLVATRKEESGAVQVWGSKGRVKDLASLVFHLSIVLLLVGGLVGRMTGYSYIQQLGRGDSSPVKERDFSVRCDWFEVDRTDRGEIRDYKSKLTLVAPGGTEIVSKVIEVNSPLSHGGIRFYQSSYGAESTRADSIRLFVREPLMDSSGYLVVVPLETPVAVGDSGHQLVVQRFLSDFVIDMESRQAFSRAADHENPAVRVAIYSGADTLYGGWVFARHPGVHARADGYQVTFMGYERVYYTGVQVRNNPGVPLIWVGIIFMSIAVCSVFYITRRNLWAFVGPAVDGKVPVKVGGSANQPGGLLADLERIRTDLTGAR